MKRFVMSLFLLLLISGSVFAQNTRNLRFSPGQNLSGGSRTGSPLLQRGQTVAPGQFSQADKQEDGTGNEGVDKKQRFSSKEAAAALAELDKNDPEYYRRRMEQLEYILRARTREQIISEKIEEISVAETEAAEEKKPFDEREEELKKTRTTFIDEREIEKEVDLRLDSETELRHFGKKFFEEGEIYQGSLFSSAAPSNYLLGPGDELKIIVWSDMGDETVYDVQVNPEGQVYVPIIGILGVSGVTVGQFEQMVIGKLSGKFAHFKGQVTLTKLRTMQIFVVGEVEKPGAMSISGLGTAFTALYQAGGPTKRGSMRNIKVLDNHGKSSSIDLYRYLLSGDKSQDLPLKNGDTVFVPVISSQVKIAGMVTRPAIYEVFPQTSLASALQMAGNATAQAYSGRVTVVRWGGDRRRQSFDFNLDDKDALAAFILENGDEVTIDRGIEKIGNKVVVEGSVAKPGEYSYSEGLKVADLIGRSGGLVSEEANFDHGQILRKGTSGKDEILSFNVKFALAGDRDHNHTLQPLDKVRLFAQKDVIPDTRIVTIDGAVRRPGQYIFRDGMSLSDLVVTARGLTIDAAGEVEIARVKDGSSSSIIKANINEALVDKNRNVQLQPLDKISILARSDRMVEAEVVTLKGHVKFPGPYALKYRGEPLSSVIKRAGGLTTQAFAGGAIFMRRIENISSEHQLETAEGVQDEMFRQATLDLRADLLRTGAKLDSIQDVRSEMVGAQGIGSVDVRDIDRTQGTPADGTSPDKKGVTGESSAFGGIEMRSRVIQQQMIRIPVPLEKILAGRAEEFEDLALLDGDQITVPVLPKTVTVIGAVINPTTILFSNNRSARYYINRAGGFSPHSDHRRTVVVKANGEVMPLRNTNRIGRGDIVLVPPKPKLVRPDKIKEFSNLASILGNLAVTYKVVNDAK